MTVEFISAVNVNPSNELNRLGRADIDLPFFTRYVNALEDAGFDYTLCAYHSSFQDQFAIANQIVARSERVRPIVALRPNTIYPTVAANALATLDQFGRGRAVVTSSPAAATPSRHARAISAPRNSGTRGRPRTSRWLFAAERRLAAPARDRCPPGRTRPGALDAHRAATGQRGTLQADHLGALA
jgi:hypothetical protein